MSLRFLVIFAAGVLVPLAAGAAENELSEAEIAATERLGAVTGQGLYCGHAGAAVPLKEIVVSIANVRGMSAELRAELGRLYAEGRDRAFHLATGYAETCPSLDDYVNLTRLARVEFLTAFSE